MINHQSLIINPQSLTHILIINPLTWTVIMNPQSLTYYRPYHYSKPFPAFFPGCVDDVTKEAQLVQETVGIPKDGELPAGPVGEAACAAVVESFL